MNLFLDALAGQNKRGRPPIWLMRQAGRSLASYRTLREKYSLETLFHTPELAAQITLLPIHEIGCDAAILFSDILVVLEMLGYSLTFPEKKGPQVRPGAKHTFPHYVRKTIEILKKQPHTPPLIGFCGGPFTIASFLGDRKNPVQTAHENEALLSPITEACISLALSQIEAGVDAFQIFDTSAGLLTQEEFERYSYPYLKQLAAEINKKVPLILFTRGAKSFWKSLSALHPAAISVEEGVSLSHLRKEIPLSIALQGNLDPQLLTKELPLLLKEASHLLNEMQNDPRFIFNLGYGVLPQAPENHLKSLVALVKAQ